MPWIGNRGNAGAAQRLVWARFFIGLCVPMSPFRHGMVRWEGRGPVVASIRIRLVWIFCGALDAREFGAGPSGQDREQPLTTRDFVKRDMLKAA